jgi:transposase
MRHEETLCHERKLLDQPMSRPIAQPLRPLTPLEYQELQRVSRAPSETVSRHQRAIALLAVADGKSLIEAARAAGWRVHDTVTRLIRRFNERGLAALDDLPRRGHPRRYGLAERARIEQELQRSPLLKEDGTATWSLTTLQRSLREAPDGLSQISTFTLLHSIHEAGYTWQQNRTWCKTGTTLHKGKQGVQERQDPYTQEKKRSSSEPI